MSEVERERRPGVCVPVSQVHPFGGVWRPDEETRARQEQVARVAARAVNEGDAEPLVALLAPDVVRTSQNWSEDVVGREAVAGSLRDGIARAWDGMTGPPRAEIGRAWTQHLDATGVILIQHRLRRVFWAFEFDDEGRIAQLNGYTVAPHPTQVTATGELPGFDPERFARVDRAARERRCERVRSLEGPLEFVVFELSDSKLAAWEELYQAAVAPQYPGARVTAVLLRPGELAQSEEDDATHELACEAGVRGLPAVAVRRGGEWIRAAEGSPSPQTVLRDLAELGLPGAEAAYWN